MTKTLIPDRGDIVWLDFNPTKGHEQKGHRPAIVVSPKNFNLKNKMCWVVPMTNTVRGHAFEVIVNGKKGNTTGVAITQQIRAIDYKARSIVIKDRATDQEIQDVLARIQAIVK